MKNLLEKVEIIYEDEFLLGINKPSGLIIHSDGRTEELNLINWLENFCLKNNINVEIQKNIGRKHTLDSGRYEYRWGILNRLDRETSGIILIAKDSNTFEILNTNWQNNVKKKYIAILHGEINMEKLLKENKIENIFANKFKINESISRHKKDPRIWVLKSDEGSRDTVRQAETIFEIVKVIPPQTPPKLKKDQKFTLVNFWPITGRTHQLRLHAKFLGHPIVGDKKYSLGGIDNILEIDNNNRLMLHAESVEFIHPTTKENIKIIANNFDFGEFKNML